MNHDHSYKLLFSEPEIIADLLHGFVHEDWVKELDFSTLEKVSGSYISDDLRAREDGYGHVDVHGYEYESVHGSEFHHHADAGDCENVCVHARDDGYDRVYVQLSLFTLHK